MIFITTITTITTHYYSSITSVLFYLRIHYFSYSHYYCHSSLSVVNLKSHFNPTCIGLFKQLLSKSEKRFVHAHWLQEGWGLSEAVCEHGVSIPELKKSTNLKMHLKPSVQDVWQNLDSGRYTVGGTLVHQQTQILLYTIISGEIIGYYRL